VILPLRVQSRLVRRDVPILLAVSMAVWGMASAGRRHLAGGCGLAGGPGASNTIWEIRTSREAKISEAADYQGGLSKKAVPREITTCDLGESDISLNAGPDASWWPGLAVLIWGSQILVKGATAIALGLGVSRP